MFSKGSEYTYLFNAAITILRRQNKRAILQLQENFCHTPEFENSLCTKY